MPQQDTSPLKEKIVASLKTKGPSLPVHIAHETGLSMLFASAFLSELIAERKITTSSMKVGSSPIYLVPGQESRLETFGEQYLKSKEKEAFDLLKQKRFLEDSKQPPAIRVALRAIKDFAIAFKNQDKIIWRYFTVPESDFEEKKKLKKVEQTFVKQESAVKKTSQEQNLNIFEKKTEKSKKKKRKTSSSKANQKFFNRVKEFLIQRSLEILDIVSFSKSDLVLKIRENEQEQLIVAYNKKRITEKDIVKAYKKASDLGLRFTVLFLGEPTKKLSDFLSAAKNLTKIGKLE